MKKLVTISAFLLVILFTTGIASAGVYFGFSFPPIVIGSPAVVALASSLLSHITYGNYGYGPGYYGNRVWAPGYWERVWTGYGWQRIWHRGYWAAPVEGCGPPSRRVPLRRHRRSMKKTAYSRRRDP